MLSPPPTLLRSPPTSPIPCASEAALSLLKKIKQTKKEKWTNTNNKHTHILKNHKNRNQNI